VTGLPELPPRELAAGDWVEGYQLIARAPVSFIAGPRSRHIGGLSVRGAWSDPWWAYDPARGWAVARRWKSKVQETIDWSGGWQASGRVTILARDEVIVEPYTAEEASA